LFWIFMCPLSKNTAAKTIRSCNKTNKTKFDSTRNWFIFNMPLHGNPLSHLSHSWVSIFSIRLLQCTFFGKNWFVPAIVHSTAHEATASELLPRWKRTGFQLVFFEWIQVRGVTPQGTLLTYRVDDAEDMLEAELLLQRCESSCWFTHCRGATRWLRQ
jgi:hypothetical protein